ncbi:uncharacterized protein DNG_05685 [Cephalotrichum gorgonifer]|uniref:Conserved oligomeric Golgi complex subunit 1 n=1 Tax=Cephalotrichum gorgonifer TaxID=2041049 RepID=A0AAE8N036_9PEZI|nr:uncharacterized protein DNG_05685 [Cephalotrichum gorgonifer]
MATPDISSLTSASEVFAPSHTLPQIRAIHKTIHAELNEKAARLRSQVGGSYRELLGTADAIVRMRAGNDEVQGVLAGMGARCGRGVVWGKVNGMGNFVGGSGEDRGPVTLGEGGLGTGEMARLQLLEACTLTASRVLRGGDVGGGLGRMGSGDRLVLATKLLILARLLIKSFGDRVEDEQARAALEAAEKSRLALRRKLSKCVERVLERCGEESDRGHILKALAAYSLATNSGARDSLKHFLAVREKAMRLALETLLDVQAVAPSNLSDALASLKKRALLADSTIQKLEVLRLDICERWCGEDVQFFTPFIRHDDLDGKQAKEMLTAWADTGKGIVISGLERVLGTMSEFKGIVELRTRVLQLWIGDGARARGFDPSEMLDRLRRAINARLLAVLEVKVGKLHLVGSEVAATLNSWREGVTDAQESLWDEDTYDMDLSNGVAAFLQNVMSRMYGRNDAVSKAVNCYASWRHVIDDVDGVVEHLKKQRWDDDIEDLEDDDVIEARQEALSKDDPAALRERLDVTLEKAFKALEQRLAALWAEREGGADSGPMAMFLVRVLRDVRTALPKMESLGGFGLEMVPSLHGKMAREVVVAPVDEFVAGPLARRTVVGRALWEGSPEMPSVPTPGMFMFLRDLSKGMGAAGMDLWSPAAVRVLKGLVSTQICEAWREALGGLTEAGEKSGDGEDKGEEGSQAEKDGEETSTKDDEEQTDDGEKPKAELGSDAKGEATGNALTGEQRDLLLQWFFDVSYFRCCFEPADGSKEWKSLADAVYERAELGDDALRERLAKSSEEYWKRTSLLFGLLA